MDKNRSAAVSDILEHAERAGITTDCGIAKEDAPDEKLLKLDNFLCDLKELQIRDGLHIFGRNPNAKQTGELLAQILRAPRGDGDGANASLLRALARDLELTNHADDDDDETNYDPLTAIAGENGPVQLRRFWRQSTRRMATMVIQNKGLINSRVN